MNVESKTHSRGNIRNAFKWWSKKKNASNSQTYKSIRAMQTLESPHAFVTPRQNVEESSSKNKYLFEHGRDENDIKIRSFFRRSFQTLQKSRDEDHEDVDRVEDFLSIEDLSKIRKVFTLPIKLNPQNDEVPDRSASCHDLTGNIMSRNNEEKEEKEKQRGAAKVLGRFTSSLSNLTKIGKNKKLKRSHRSHDDITDNSINCSSKIKPNKKSKWKFRLSTTHSYDLQARHKTKSSSQNDVTEHYRALSWSPFYGVTRQSDESLRLESPQPKSPTTNIVNNEKESVCPPPLRSTPLEDINSKEQHIGDTEDPLISIHDDNAPSDSANMGCDGNVFLPMSDHHHHHHNLNEDSSHSNVMKQSPFKEALRDSGGEMVNVSETNLNFLSESSSSSSSSWNCFDIEPHRLSLGHSPYHASSFNSDLTEVTSMTSYSSNTNSTDSKEIISPESIEIIFNSSHDVAQPETGDVAHSVTEKTMNFHKEVTKETISFPIQISDDVSTQYLKKPITVTSQPSFGELEREFNKFILEYKAKRKLREENQTLSKKQFP